MSTPQAVTTTDTSDENIEPGPHAHVRWFIGPMPEKVVRAQESSVLKKSKPLIRWWWQSKSTQGTHERVPPPEAIQQHAFTFFLVSGGKESEWGEETEGHIMDEMMQKWRNSEWGRTFLGEEKKEKRMRNESWVGTSFEVGNFLGMNLLREPNLLRARPLRSKMSHESITASSEAIAGPSSQAEGKSFVTAPLAPPTSGSASDIQGSINGVSPPETPSALSTTGLLRPPIAGPMLSAARTEPLHILTPRTPTTPAARSEGGILSPLSRKNWKGKAKQVHYAEPPANEEPAPPGEVLERSGHAVDGTSAGASVGDTKTPARVDGDVVMRDRMLVRISYTKAGSVEAPFDEARNRTTTHLEHIEWAELLTAWRRDTAGNQWIELYDNYTVPGKESLLHHKHLAFIIPLTPPACRLSVYSFIDLTFCITCPPMSTAKAGGKVKNSTRPSKQGTNIFVFKLQSRTRTFDWIWRLWIQLGGVLPPFLEVRNTSTETRINVDIPPHSINADGYANVDFSQNFTRENVKQLCIRLLTKIPEWRVVVERDTSDGLELELAWRFETCLDWVWLEYDLDGRKRDWAVLAGLAIKQLGKPCYLELRRAEHAPSSVLENGEILVRPPSVEGYLDLIRPTSQAKQPVYLSTHENILLILPRARAFPPPPPGTLLTSEATKQMEVERGAQQILNAYGAGDLRNVVAVRQAFQRLPQFVTEPPAKKGKSKDIDDWANAWAMAEADAGGDGVAAQSEGDEGGDEGLAKAADKGSLVTRRSFELLLVGGNIFRFETYSREVALEWVGRLRALIRYWRQRHRVDAREEMDLAQLASSRVTPRVRPYDDPNACPEPPVNPNSNFPALGAMYNWCVMDGCSSIAKRGRLFMRRGLRGQYRLVEMILTLGCLVQYHIKRNSSVYLRQSRLINLADAYVCSGYLAALALPRDQYDAAAPPVARRYQDGLEVDDSDEDTLFVILYRSKATLARNDQNQGPATTAPKLGAKRKLAVFRTRSKLERDAWCWAIGCEIEKLARKTKGKEVVSGLA